jgi:hypothetical protein
MKLSPGLTLESLPLIIASGNDKTIDSRIGQRQQFQGGLDATGSLQPCLLPVSIPAVLALIAAKHVMGSEDGFDSRPASRSPGHKVLWLMDT